MLQNKTIIIGVTASVAIYKTCELIRQLRQLKAKVLVMMSQSATNLINPQLLAVLSGHEVLTTLFGHQEGMKHIALAKEADVMLICPASANIIAKLAHGLADDLITTTVLATKAPILICPAMNPVMWSNQLLQDNVKRLQKFGMIIVPPDRGEMACGDEGEGRLAEIKVILEMIKSTFTAKDLLNKKILITAGPTLERIDPVRYISNFSSGKMGMALARVAARRGAEVTLILGGRREDRSLSSYKVCQVYQVANDQDRLSEKEEITKEGRQGKGEKGMKIIELESAREMYEAVKENIKGQEVFISAAAVSDFRPKVSVEDKLKKVNLGKSFNLELIQNPDILQMVSQKRGSQKKPFLVGFALETRDELQAGKTKWRAKKVDLLVINGVENLGQDQKKVWLFDGKDIKEWPLLPVEEVAAKILDEVKRENLKIKN